MSTIRAVKGMPDLLPEQLVVWHHLESVVSQLLDSYGYQQIRLPLVESTSLFKRAVGEVTDIIEKEMYSFPDRNDESLSLRPEGTAGCVRACIQNGLLREARRLWYAGPMFRYERPQKGRQRQFHQVGLEAFGWSDPDIDAELILLSARLWKALGIADVVWLEINSLGESSARAAHKADLLHYLQTHKEQLDADSVRRLDSNPLRIFDSKVPQTQALLAKAPKLLDYLDADSQAHFAALRELLDACGVQYRVNPHLVRGLDYYNRTVFEWVTDALGAQGTVCAGGRYDTLVEQLGGKPTPAVGMAMGVERLCLLLETLGKVPAENTECDVYVIVGNESDTRKMALSWIESLRTQLPHSRIRFHVGGGSFKSQMKKADKSGAHLALIIGEQEAAQGLCGVKLLRDETAEQFSCAHTALAETLKEYL